MGETVSSEANSRIAGESDAAVRKVPPADDVLLQLEAVRANAIFRKADILRNILTFLGRGLADSPGTSFKEHEIAIGALGRTGDFDPRLDSTVRVHTARLRTKLAEYYAGDGLRDPIVFDIPKGSYQLTARYSDVPAVVEPGRKGGLVRLRVWGPLVWAVVATVAAVVLGTMAHSVRRPAPPEALRTFWQGFVEPGEQTTLVFSNTRFRSGPDGMMYVPQGYVAPEQLNEYYTGTGEVHGVSALAGLFASYWTPVRIKRGRLLTWDDARQQNLVFVGGPDVNLQLGQLPELQRFRFSHPGIIDVQSDPVSPLHYASSGKPYSFDHAVIALAPVGTGRKMLVLAGGTTMGTQGAVDYVTREDTTQKLLRALKAPRAGPVPPFEALLRVQVADGVPVQSQIVAVHFRK
jgi:hypothetical protein